MGALTTIRPELLTLTEAQISALMPYAWIFGGAILAMLLGVAKSFRPKWPIFVVTVASCVLAIVSVAQGLHQDSQLLFNGMMVADRYSSFFNFIFLASAALTILASFRYLDRENLQHPEYYVLL